LLGKALAAVTVVGLSTVGLYKFMTARVFDREDRVFEPPYFTSIVMCSLNEEAFIERALQSLEDQNVLIENPRSFERIVIDSHSEDETVRIAEDYGWKVYQAPLGKLNARHLGMQKAKGEVVVSVDCDSFYPPNWLNLVLRHFNHLSVVGVTGPRLAHPEESLLNTGLSVWFSLVELSPIGGLRLNANNCAFYKYAYCEAGGFNLSINQQNPHEMVREEEIGFALKLRRVGRLDVDLEAAILTSGRRLMGMMKKGERYKKFTEERLRGERF
jgi:glycosyltransferase involved in cell wall biosynthesis